MSQTATERCGGFTSTKGLVWTIVTSTEHVVFSELASFCTVFELARLECAILLDIQERVFHVYNTLQTARALTHG
jgi:hypothetical protein